jgi:glycosyltransferase involved in cell wall biosynthesis
VTADNINLISNWYKIHENLCKLKVNPNPIIPPNDIFVIVADGGWSNWTGSDINKNGVGGSETWVIETARNLKLISNMTVIVFCKTDCFELFEGVEYRPLSKFHSFVSNNVVKHCVISRFTEYIPTALHSHCESVSVIFHDLLPPEVIIPKHPKIKNIFGLTDWHKNYIKSIFPDFTINTTNYGINEIQNASKIKNSFIYSSFPNRGLVILMRMWPRIRKILPDATLNIYCNLDHDWVNKVAPEDINEIKTLLKLKPSGVTNHGWVNKKTLKNAWATADYWLYPCKFEETFCLTAFEAAISKTFVISNNLAGLSETVGDRGLVVYGDARTEEWQENILDALANLDSQTKENLIEKNWNYVKQRSWLDQTKLFSTFF